MPRPTEQPDGSGPLGLPGGGTGKAGAYAVQGRAAAFIERIEGSYSGVMGLPLHETWQLLRNFGVPAWSRN